MVVLQAPMPGHSGYAPNPRWSSGAYAQSGQPLVAIILPART